MKYVPQAITRAVGNTVLRAQKNSPTILFAVGVTGAVTATVLACRATLKAQPVVDHWKKDLVDLEAHASRSRQLDADTYKRDLAHMHMINVAKVAKLYIPATTVGIVSLACLTRSHIILKQREAALTTAYVGLQTFLEGYRSRVRKAIGAEEEERVYYAATPVELVEDDGKNGTKKVYGSTPNVMSPYSVYFDERNMNWQDAAEYNVNFIRIQEQLLTDRLRSKGSLFLNDVYDRLGILDENGVPFNTEQGQLCGWHVDHPDSDDFVEIRITPVHDFHGTLLLDFNVAGLVYKMLGEGKKR